MTRATEVSVYDNALLRAIPRQFLAELDLRLDTVTFDAGQVIFEENAEGDCCYLVQSGVVRISKEAGSHTHETLGFIRAGEFFGELALYRSAPRSTRATASTDTVAARLDREEFRRLRDAAPLEITSAIANAGIGHLREIHTYYLSHLTDADRLREVGFGLGMIAHDIRSPLATILNAAQLLSELMTSGPVNTEQLLKYASMIERTAGSALKSADELLADIRGEAEPQLEPVWTGELVQEVTENVLGMIARANVDFATAVENPALLVCNRQELVRALVNILRNAVEALPPGGGAVRLQASGDADGVVFLVTDTGSGIPADIQARLFERRFSHGKSGGTGLGLDQVRRAVEKHGGHIEVQSEVGRGTTFRIRIPNQPDAAMTERHQALPHA